MISKVTYPAVKGEVLRHDFGEGAVVEHPGVTADQEKGGQEGRHEDKGHGVSTETRVHVLNTHWK